MNNIKACRVRSGISRTYLAEKLGVSPQAVSKWELNISDPKWSQAVAIAKALDCAIGDLFLTPNNGRER